MRGARGQVTAFVLVGLLLVFVVVFLLFLRASFSERPTDPAGLGQDYDAERVDAYVAQCLGLVGEQGLALVAKQGGPIYTWQGGTFDEWHTLPVRMLDEDGLPTGPPLNISFGLKAETGFPFRPPRTYQECYASSDCKGHDPHISFWYPWPGYAIGEPSGLDRWNDRQYDGAFGQKALPPLCDPEGPNSRATENANLLCPYLAAPGEPSIQSALESYVENGLRSCLDQDELTKILGDARMGRPNVTVLLTRSETVIEAAIPLTFVDDNTFRSVTFTKRLPVRLFKTYAFASTLLNRASKDPAFHLAEDYASIPGGDAFLILQDRLSAAAVTPSRSDLYIVQVLDGGSAFKKGAFSLQFLIENRRPVLDATGSVKTGEECCKLNEDGECCCLVTGNCHAAQDIRFRLTVSAVDPDGSAPANNLTADLVFTDPKVMAQAHVEPLPSDPLTLDVTLAPGACGCHTCGNCGIPANLSVKDIHGLVDWERISVVFVNAPCRTEG